MGSGYNHSLAASRSARSKASTRTPSHFYLSVPMYEYDLGCGRNSHLHTFQSRTPLVEMEEETLTVWCSGCQLFREIDPTIEPLNRPISTDEIVAFEQDKGILRERIARSLQDIGFVDNEADVAKLAVEFGVPVGEIKRINAGLRAPDGLSGLPDLCKAGLHEMTIDNIKVTKHGRQCLICYREKDKQAKARRRAANLLSDGPPTHNRR